MTLRWARSQTFTAAAVALMAAPSMFASALDLTVANCDDLRNLTETSNLSEDTTLLLDVPTETFGNPDLNWIACEIVSSYYYTPGAKYEKYMYTRTAPSLLCLLPSHLFF